MLLPVATKPGAKEEGSLLNMFLSGKSVYAIGPGGVGKTTTMFRAAEYAVRELEKENIDTAIFVLKLAQLYCEQIYLDTTE